jgi:transcriptional regulator GlxA family with amidase domain
MKEQVVSGSTRIVALLLFPEVEVLDFAGPFEVFSIAAGHGDPPPFRVLTVAATKAPVVAVGGLRVLPDHDFTDAPQAGLLLIPGGAGSRHASRDRATLDWIRGQERGVEIVASICTGALLLGKLGLLDGLGATTHWTALDELRATSPAILVRPETRFVDNGRILTSAGISAGIDMSLHIVARLCGGATAMTVAREMEYEWRRSPAGQ